MLFLSPPLISSANTKMTLNTNLLIISGNYDPSLLRPTLLVARTDSSSTSNTQQQTLQARVNAFVVNMPQQQSAKLFPATTSTTLTPQQPYICPI